MLKIESIRLFVPIRLKPRFRATDAAEPADMRRFAITRPLRLIDNALEYWLAHAFRVQAATVQNSNLDDWFYPFCIRLGAVENGGLLVMSGSSRTRRRAAISAVMPSFTSPAYSSAPFFRRANRGR